MSLQNDEDDEELTSKDIVAPSLWQAAVHTTGWMKKINLMEFPISKVDGLQPESNNTTLSLSYKLLQAGKLAQPNTASIPGSKTKTPNDILDSDEPLQLKPYQLHNLELLKRNINGGGNGLLCALEMGLGKTIIAIGIYYLLLFGRPC